jgi:hypothetical protein
MRRSTGMKQKPVCRAEGKRTINTNGEQRPGKAVMDTRTGNSRRRLLLAGLWSAGFALLAGTLGVWITVKAEAIEGDLKSAAQLVPGLKDRFVEDRADEAAAIVEKLKAHTSAARSTAEDPVWRLASALPWLGPNFSAVAEVAYSADDVANLGLAPLAKSFGSLEWQSLLPSGAGPDLNAIEKASPDVSAAAHAVQASAQRLNSIDTNGLLPQVAGPLRQARDQLNEATDVLIDVADASRLAPTMLGSDGARNYLVMIQNNAEARASGGIPGALAILSVDQGKLKLGNQSSAAAIGVMSPVLSVDPDQEQIYSSRLGKYMQDVNLTPDFPTAAATARKMWERKTGERVDGVISLDPVALSYLLTGTGPIKTSLTGPAALADTGLPIELNSKNVVRTLLSDVYAKIEQPALQDAYFTEVAQQVFAALSSGKGNPKGLIEGIKRGAAEGRLLIWSNVSNEQDVLAKYPLSGSVAGSSVSPAQFGVYFNDGTGAKMDYYVKRTVQLEQECTRGDYAQIKVRVTSKNTAPPNSASTLPAYVTGGGIFGVPAGTVQTNIVAYGPVQANVVDAAAEGRKVPFASQRHAGRPVGTVTVRLAPGQSSTVEFTFGKIVQHTEPVVAVTPTIQNLKEVVLETKSATCAPAA